MTLGRLEVPEDYLDLADEMKKELCEELIDALLKVLDKQLVPDMDRVKFLKELLNNTIAEQEKQEQYELCQVLTDLRTLINE